MGNYAVKMQLDFVLFALQNKVAHTLPCTVDLGLYGTHRKVKFLGYFVVGVILQKTHCEEAAIVLGQAVDIVLNLSALLEVDEILLGGWRNGCRSRKFFVYRDVFLTATLEVDMGIAGDGIDPLSEGVFGRIAVQVYIYFDECLLQ